MAKPKPRRVLIIEDERRGREEIKRAFTMDEEFVFEVTELATVEEALRILEKEKRFDLVVIDWRLNDKREEGLEVLNKAKIHMPKIKIVYTAYATLDDCVRAMRAGAYHYIDKNQPGSLKKLLECAKEKLRTLKFEDHEPDSEWLYDHLEELRDKYYGQLIAFIDGKIVDHGKSKRELEERVMKKYGEKPYIMFAPMEVV